MCISALDRDILIVVSIMFYCFGSLNTVELRVFPVLFSSVIIIIIIINIFNVA